MVMLGTCVNAVLIGISDKLSNIIFALQFLRVKKFMAVRYFRIFHSIVLFYLFF